MNRDLTVGKPSAVLWRFCLPLFASVIFQQLYNIADSLIAGKLIGENALAAVGNSYEVTLIFIAFAFGCNVGCSVVVARLFGAKDHSGLKTAVHTALISTVCLLAVLMALGLAFGKALLRLIDTPESILDDSAAYLSIYTLSLPFMFFYNISNGIFSALGNSRTPFIFLAASSTANVFMDVLFVKVFRLGVPGVAWATFLCQGVSCVLAVIVVFRRLAELPANKAEIRLFSFPLLKSIVQVAVPSTIQQSFVSIGNVIIQRVINGFGDGTIAGYAAAIKLNNLVITSFATISGGISNYTAQNLGAGKRERVPSGYNTGVRMLWLIAIPFAGLYFFFGEFFLRLFMDRPSPDALRTGITLLRILAPFYFVIPLKMIADGVLRGAGLMRYFMIGTFTDLVLRVVLAILLSKTSLGSTGIWIAWPIGWCVATVMCVLFYRDKFIKHPGLPQLPRD
ncbi:MAG: MATE family efflux transporter [Clostridia bacterium]|nr:MATE family efflux transporter [Clostridia bacterium]